MEPASARYVVPPHPRPSGILSSEPDKPNLNSVPQNGKVASEGHGADLIPSRRDDNGSNGEALSPQDRHALDELIQRRTSH
jgi:hypothetical protein